MVIRSTYDIFYLCNGAKFCQQAFLEILDFFSVLLIKRFKRLETHNLFLVLHFYKPMSNIWNTLLLHISFDWALDFLSHHSIPGDWTKEMKYKINRQSCWSKAGSLEFKHRLGIGWTLVPYHKRISLEHPTTVFI